MSGRRETKVLKTHAQLMDNAWNHFHKIMKIDEQISRKQYGPFDYTVEMSTSPENSTSTIYTLYVLAETAQVTLADPVGACLSIKTMLDLMYTYDHGQNRSSVFKPREFVTRANASIDHSTFPAVHSQLDGICTSSIFMSGTNVVAGAKLYYCILLAAFIIYKLMTTIVDQDTGLTKYFVPTKIRIVQNGVVSVRLGFMIDSVKLSTENSGFCFYDPEYFVAVICRLKGIVDERTGEVMHKSTALIFDTGKIIISGIYKMHQIRRLIRYVYELVLPYRTDTRIVVAKKRHTKRVQNLWTQMVTGVKTKKENQVKKSISSV